MEFEEQSNFRNFQKRNDFKKSTQTWINEESEISFNLPFLEAAWRGVDPKEHLKFTSTSVLRSSSKAALFPWKWNKKPK